MCIYIYIEPVKSSSKRPLKTILVIVYHANPDLAAKKDQHLEIPSFRTMMYFSIFLGDPFFLMVSGSRLG